MSLHANILKYLDEVAFNVNISTTNLQQSLIVLTPQEIVKLYRWLSFTCGL